MKNSNPITGITLEGFQVFDKPTYIPLDRLTLLFGPNSAGKSAVQDAIDLYSKLLASGISKPFGLPHDVIELLERHWRRVGGSDDSRVAKLSMCVHCSIERDMSSNLEVESRWNFLRGENDGGEWFFCDWDFELFINSKPFASTIGTEIKLNIEHPILDPREKRNVKLLDAAAAYPELIFISNESIILKEGVAGFRPSGFDITANINHSLYWNFPYSNEYKEKREKSRSMIMETALSEVSTLIGSTLWNTLGCSGFNPVKVKASRTVPTRSDLTFEFKEVDGPFDAMQRTLIEGDLQYKRLASSLTLDLSETPEFKPPETERIYSKDVNRALSNHLFIERGYRLDYDFRVLLSKSNSHAAFVGSDLNPSEFGYRVEIFLRDSMGRKHYLEDVGSGIGYLLPILCAVFEPHSSRNTCFIQQPELHLHPALQTAMGDVFIEAGATGQQVLIETHSEHLLLRILKRIRQTHLQANIAPELKINADDVCVLYFDPSPDGTTTVKRLRITEDGEFMDRWPRGFFAERDQELLDE